MNYFEGRLCWQVGLYIRLGKQDTFLICCHFSFVLNADLSDSSTGEGNFDLGNCVSIK